MRSNKTAEINKQLRHRTYIEITRFLSPINPAVAYTSDTASSLVNSDHEVADINEVELIRKA